MRLLNCILILFFLAYPSHAIIINEVMYNPIGSDSGNEWLEIYNNDTETYNLTGWKINIDDTDHTLNVPPSNGGIGSMIVDPGNYVIIAQDAIKFLSNYPSYNGTAIDSSWDNLVNSVNKTIWIRNSTNVFHNITTFANLTEGKTFCLINSIFMGCDPTPGYVNGLVQNTTGQTDEQNNITGSCDLGLWIETSSDVYNVSTIYFDIKVNDTNCTEKDTTINYYIQDLFGNIVKAPVDSVINLACTASLQHQWTPDDMQGSEAYYIIGNIVNADCNDTNMNNNVASRLIVVKGNNIQTGSSIDIISVDMGSDNSVKYGEAANIKIRAYRGDTSKYAIDVWIENSGKKLSSISTMHAKNKFTEYEFQVPVQLKSNCDNAFNDGEYDVIADGLDITKTAKINISGISTTNCKTITISTSGGGSNSYSYTPSELFSHEITKYESTAETGEEIETIVNIVNNFTTQKNFTVYSYVYKGNNPVSSGLNEKNEWKGGYTANSISFLLNPKESKNIVLKNKIDEDTEQGMYNFRVRIKVDGKDNDITKDIYVIKSNTTNIISSAGSGIDSGAKSNNIIATNRTIEKVSKMTGLITDKPKINSNLNIFQPPLIVLFNFIMALFWA
ncbi:MAG: lamin tail domain-containing protein [Candidatus Aenigmarchaeota archaeon]|nr:lamin tail domain-containing protein [Candidatus Aenigmarchaeota archaeon]